jgi:hypothetical protein
MKIIRKSSLWERDDISLWMIAVTIAVVAFLYRLITIIFAVYPRCIQYYDTWVLSSPSLILMFFAIFEAIFVWNLVVFLDSVWQKRLSKAHLAIHIIYALATGAAVASTLHAISFSREYDSLMEYADAEWNVGPKSVFYSEECRESKKYIGRWSIENVYDPKSENQFPYREVRLNRDLEFELYDEIGNLADYGKWYVYGEEPAVFSFSYTSQNKYQEFLLDKYTADSMSLTDIAVYQKVSEKGYLTISLERLPSIERAKHLFYIDWGFVLDRDNYEYE